MTPESRLSTFVAGDGDRVVIQDWPLEPDLPLRGVVIVVHVLGAHAGRSDRGAEHLPHWGVAVRGSYQYGQAMPCVRSASPATTTRLLDDLADIIDSTRARMGANTPLILLGHSMGGLVVGRFVSLGIRPVDGLIMSSPALNAGMNAFQKFLVSLLPKFSPNLRVGNGVKPQFISHDPAVVAAYRADPLVHDRISARLARFIADAGPATLALAPQWKVPTLLMYAGDDRLLNPQGSRDFAAVAPKDVVTSRCFDSLYHEIFNEQDAKPVFAELKRWLDARF